MIRHAAGQSMIRSAAGASPLDIWIAALRPSRRLLRSLLRMRFSIMRSETYPHPEERARRRRERVSKDARRRNVTKPGDPAVVVVRWGGPRRLAAAALLLVAPLLLLAACGPAADPGLRFPAAAPPPAPAGTTAPHFTDSEFIAEDGARLPLRRWLPQAPVAAVILALHGFGDYTHAFAIRA